MTQRPHEHSGWTIGDLAARFGGEVVGVLDGAARIFRPAPLDEAGEGDISFYADRRYAAALATTRASCVLIAPDCPHAPAAVTVFV